MSSYHFSPRSRLGPRHRPKAGEATLQGGCTPRGAEATGDAGCWRGAVREAAFLTDVAANLVPEGGRAEGRVCVSAAGRVQRSQEAVKVTPRQATIRIKFRPYQS